MISICVPTRGRPERFAKMVEQARRTATGQIEFIARLDNDDPSIYPDLPGVTYVRAPRRLRDGHTEMSGLWTEAWAAATGDIAMLCGDDAVFVTHGWDAAVSNAFRVTPDRIVMVYAHDGARHPRPIMPFVSRKWIETLGYFTPEGWPGWYADTWIWSLAAELERVAFLSNVVIGHDYQPGTDETYQQGEAAREAAGGNLTLRARFYSAAEVARRDADVAKLRAQLHGGARIPAPRPVPQWYRAALVGNEQGRKLARREAVTASTPNDRADTLVVVHCYAGDRDQVQRGLPVHLAHGCKVVIACPTDAPVYLPGTETVEAGLRGYIGQVTLDRQRDQLRALLDRYPHSWFLLNDSDSFCLSPELPAYLYRRTDVFWSNEVKERRPHRSKYPKIAFHPPYFAHRSVLERLLTVNVPAHPITPFIDWYMVALACESKTPHSTFPDGHSMCAWMHGKLPKTEEQDDDYKHVQIVGGRDGGGEMRQRVLRGVNFVHAVKHEDVLASLVQARESRDRLRRKRSA